VGKCAAAAIDVGKLEILAMYEAGKLTGRDSPDKAVVRV
jgi:hypothetical protein